MRLVPDPFDLLRFEAAMLALGETVKDPRALLEEVATQGVYPAIADIFDNEGYGAWGGLTEAYAVWKAKNASGEPLMQLSGALRESLTLEGAPGNIHQFSDDGTLVIGSSLVYFGVQNTLRPIAQPQEQHFESMTSAAIDNLADSAKDLGFEVTKL